MVKKYEELDFTDDFLFCKILYNNSELTKQLLELILEIRIERVEFVEKQKPIEITGDARGVRLDVYLEDEAKSVYDIEMQTTRSPELPKRARYYQGMIDLNLIERGEHFGKLKESFVIFICLSDPFGRDLRRYVFENVCVTPAWLSEAMGTNSSDGALRLNDGAYKIFLNAAGVAEDEMISDELKAFLEFIRCKSIRSAFTEKLAYEVEMARAHKEWRLEYMTLQMREDEIREEARAEGRTEGRAERDREIILEMLKKISPEEIAELCGFPLEFVEDVAKG